MLVLSANQPHQEFQFGPWVAEKMGTQLIFILALASSPIMQIARFLFAHK